MSLIDALTARVEAMAMRRARVWASALAADPANPSHDFLGLMVGAA